MSTLWWSRQRAQLSGPASACIDGERGTGNGGREPGTGPYPACGVPWNSRHATSECSSEFSFSNKICTRGKGGVARRRSPIETETHIAADNTGHAYSHGAGRGRGDKHTATHARCQASKVSMRDGLGRARVSPDTNSWHQPARGGDPHTWMLCTCSNLTIRSGINPPVATTAGSSLISCKHQRRRNRVGAVAYRPARAAQEPTNA